MNKIVIAAENSHICETFILYAKNELSKIKFNTEILKYSQAASENICDIELTAYTLCDLPPKKCIERDVYNGVFILENGSECSLQKLISIWVGTPHLRVIVHAADANIQKQKLMQEILHLIGYPVSYEIERKYLIEYPDTEFLKSLSCCRAVPISQTYLKSGSMGESRRIRKRGGDGDCIYIKTEKIKISDTKRIENEFSISCEQYQAELECIEPGLKTITKTRWCLMYNNTYFEIDVFPFWNNQAYAEVELLNEKDEIIFPDFIKIIKEVTSDKSYTNHSLAKNIPNEK